MAIWLIALSAQIVAAALPTPEQIHIDVTHSPNNAIGEAFEKQITETLLDFKGTLNRLDEAPAKHTHDKPYNALIIIGDDALARMTAWPKGYGIIIAVHVSPARFAEKQSSLTAEPGTHVTALFSGSPIERQLRLAQLIMPHANTWAVPYHPDRQQTIDAVLKQAPDTITLRPYTWTDNTEAIKGFQVPLRQADAVLALDSLGAVTPESIRGLILSAYRQSKPVIGMDAAYVRAGVLAATDSSTEHYLLESESILRDWLAGKPLAAPGYPREFSVHINARVAQSLNLILPDEQTLADTLRQQEATP